MEGTYSRFLAEMTDGKLIDEIFYYKKEVKFWEEDLQSSDEDDIAEARRFIRIATRRLKMAQEEMARRRKGVKK